MPCFDDFDIDLVSALQEQLLAAFVKLDTGPVGTDLLSEHPDGQGVYLLYYESELVYVGKADSLRRRLNEHHAKIDGRRGIEVSSMSFKCLFLSNNWAALAPETSLLAHFKKIKKSPKWNGNGFGPHDPGRNRETTNKPPQGFDARYRITDQWPCDWIKAGEWNCLELLLVLKAKLPYLLRFQVSNKNSLKNGHPEYNDIVINVPNQSMPSRDLLRLIADNLPGWQATVFPGHMILYKEDREYDHGEVLKPL